MPFQNQFSWSISRESLFNECARKYYFHYYLSWEGWKRSSSPLRREAFKLKRLVSLPLWRGQLVHYIATKVLQSTRVKGRIPAAEDVTGYLEERFKKQLDFSRRRLYLTEPKKSGEWLNINWLALFEHEYGRDLSEERIEKTLRESIQGVETLLRSDILGIIFETDRTGWIIENIDLGEFAQVFVFEGANVFAKTDFIFTGNDGTFNIVDWKTFSGKNGGDDEDDKGKAGVQLGVYGYYAAVIGKNPVDTIRLYEVNLLGSGRHIEHKISGENIDSFREHIKEGISKMASLLVDGNIHLNQPLPHRHFAMNQGPHCRYCNFFRICVDEESPLRLE
ncbi:MAG: PD-(D/E)XK nuclease family protein [Candidatus Krumholzibacteriota bacterium]|nr:PD-(D/E)XK nuclease family protein [Candidatus Krumholzibacteriota bacterium]